MYPNLSRRKPNTERKLLAESETRVEPTTSVVKGACSEQCNIFVNIIEWPQAPTIFPLHAVTVSPCFSSCALQA
jgi:hypothetical protein